jgi:predicted permease
MRGWALGSDLKFAGRQIRRAPGFALSAILTLALGIGANTGIFSLLTGYLRPLPVPFPDRIVIIAADFPSDEAGFRYRFSYPALLDYRGATDIFSDVLAFDTRIGGLTAQGKTTQFVYHVVTGDFFPGLNLSAAAGRLIERGEGEHSNSERIVVLGHSFWQRRFGGDPSVIGTIVRVDGDPARVIGVAPAGFHGLYQGAEIEGYMPIGAWRGPVTRSGRLFTDRTIRFLTLVGRLRTGTSIATAQAAVDVIARRLQDQYPEERNVTARVLPEPLARPVPVRFLSNLWPLVRGSMLGLATLVMLIACMNVANLLLVRATVREREMAVRAALGSGRARLIRLLLAESVLLSLAGAVAGLLAARWATDVFLGTLDLGVDVPLNLDFHYDWRVFVYAGATSLATGVLIGLAPALRASRAEVTALLHDGGYGGSVGGGRQRVRSVLAVAQLAGSLVLLIVAGLCIRTLHRAQFVDLGFDPEHVLTVRLDPHQTGYTLPRSDAFYKELERRIRALPGVDNVSMSFSVPMGYIFDSCAIQREGQIVSADDPQAAVGCNPVTPAYFDTMRIPIVQGRGFTEYDDERSANVIVVNETLAQQVWPGQNPIGKRLVISRFAGSLWQVVGVARNSKYLAVFEDPLPHVYFSMPQNSTYLRVVQVRSASAPEVLGPLLQREIQALDPEMPVADLKTMRQMVAGGMGYLMFRMGAVQASAMGLLGLLLAIVGVYGVVSYGAAQRTREMGIRLALGADPSAVRTLVLRQGLVLVVGGIACGLAIGAAVTPFIARFFFMVSATDVPTFAAVTALLCVIGGVACYLPARRAMRVDPMTALRHE